MLSISNLRVSVEGDPILKGLTLQVQPGTIHALMGPNGSGKSTLAYTLMGHPHYTITDGHILLRDQVLNDLSPDKRAKLGLFLAFQHPLEIPGVTVAAFMKESLQAVTGKSWTVKEFNDLLERTLQELSMDMSFAQRSLNTGFSGGEKKRLEVLQMLLLKPQIVILDEIDSGLDVDALKVVAAGVMKARQENPSMSIIIITHYQRILDYILPDCVHIMCDGVIATSGTAQLALQIEAKGYDGLRAT